MHVLVFSEAAHSKEAYHPKAPRVKLEPPPGPEKGGWGLPMVSYDGLNLELIKSLNERGIFTQNRFTALFIVTHQM